MAFDSDRVHASHRLDVVVGMWVTALVIVAALAWGGMALTAAAALFARR